MIFNGVVDQIPSKAPEKLTLTRNGIWLADGVEITHQPTRELFSQSIFRDEDGYFIHIGRESKRLHVEDTAYFIKALDRSSAGKIQIILSDGKKETLEPSTLRYRPGRLTCEITRRSLLEEAKFLHVAYFDLLKDLEEDAEAYFLMLDGRRIVLFKRATSRRN